MSFELIEYSIVVTANDYNPTILNPDFLRINKIVREEDWGWSLAGPAITTPPFATVQYDSGISIVVETNTLLVVDKKVAGGVIDSKVSEIVSGYIKHLPHVRYGAVGINFKSLVRLDSAVDYVKRNFLNVVPWERGGYVLDEADLKLKFKLKDSRLTLTIDNAIATDGSSGQQSKLLLASSNFHHPCVGYPASDQVLQFLTNVDSCKIDFDAILKGAFEND